MKIAIIAPTEIPARRANTIQVMKMAQAFVGIGHQVFMATPDYGPLGARKPDWSEIARHYGLQRQFPIEWLPAYARMRRYDFSLRGLIWSRRLRADLLYTRLPQAAALAARLGMQTIYEIHDLPQGRMGPFLLRIFLHSRGASRLVVITHALASDLKKQYYAPDRPQFTIIAPDGVDLDRYDGLPDPAQARQKLAREIGEPRRISDKQSQADYNAEEASGGNLVIERILESSFVAGYSGHLYPGRGSDVLLALAKRLPEITFLISGGEPMDVQELRERAKTANLNNFFLVGFVPNAELPLYQAACDALLMPYQQRVAASSGGDIAPYLSPMKLFEYLACKRVILSSDLPVLREVLNAKNAILLPHDNIDAWAGALQKVKNEPEYRERLANQARLDASNYTWEERAKRILKDIKN